MGWIEVLPDFGVDQDTVAEMNKDVTRLSTIASRFSKIGSVPQMEPAEANKLVSGAAGYMSTRISSNVKMTTSLDSEPLSIQACAPLLEWVMENLIKNAVDAMGGNGSISISTFAERGMAVIEIADISKGISRKISRMCFARGSPPRSAAGAWASPYQSASWRSITADGYS